MQDQKLNQDSKEPSEEAEADAKVKESSAKPKEIGGREGPEPTRFGDWEKNGIISDF